MVEPWRSRWQRRLWAGCKIGPLFFQAMQVKESGCLGEASPAETGPGWAFMVCFCFVVAFLVRIRLLHISRPQHSGLEGGT